jgi:hypothetical protein
MVSAGSNAGHFFRIAWFMTEFEYWDREELVLQSIGKTERTFVDL